MSKQEKTGTKLWLKRSDGLRKNKGTLRLGLSFANIFRQIENKMKYKERKINGKWGGDEKHLSFLPVDG